MRKYGLEEPYERLKEATRGQKITASSYLEVLGELKLPPEAYDELKDVRPDTYLGLAAELCEETIK